MLVEREKQLQTLTALVDDLRRGEGHVALVIGEAGIGKTSLINAMVTRLPTGIRLWRGGCDNLVTANPFGPFREALRREDGALLTSLTSSDGLGVLTALTDRLSGTLPTLLLIEDLHWADEASLDVLTYLARRLERLQLLMTVSYRDETVGRDHPIHRFLAALNPARTVRLALPPLSIAGVRTLATGSGWDHRELHATTNGNPFYVTEAIAGPPGTAVPMTVSAAVGIRLQGLSTAARAALDQVCVWPGVLEFDVAQELLEENLLALNEAEEAGVIVAEGAGLRFRHEIARRATAARLSSLHRRSIERRVTDVLKRRGERDLSRLVHHASACGDTATVAACAPIAARQSTIAGAHRQALAFYQAALEHEALLDDHTLADVLDGYAWELHIAHRFAEAVTHGARAVEFYQTLGRTTAEAMSLVRLMRPLYLSGDIDQARACAERAVLLVEDDDAQLTAAALSALGSVCALSGDCQTAVDSLTRAREIAVQIGHAEIEATCLNYLSECTPGLDNQSSIRLLRDSVAVATRGGADERVARGYINLAEVLYREGDFDSLEGTLAEAVPYIREHGFWSHAFDLECAEGLLLVRRGDWDGALAALRAAIDRYDSPGMLRLYCLPSYLRLKARRGELPDKSELTDCWRQALHQRWLTGLGLAGTALLEWAWLNGDLDEAARVLRQWEPHRMRPTAGPIDGELRVYGRLAGLDTPARTNTDDDNAGPWRASLRGDWTAAARRWREVGDRYEEAIAWLASADRDAVVQAWQAFTDLDAKPAARQARRRLADLGLRTVPRGLNRQTRTNPAQLTERQMQVARWLAKGLTNAEIAQEMVVSVRTVDHHVSAILTKFGVTRRRAVAAALRNWDRKSHN